MWRKWIASLFSTSSREEMQRDFLLRTNVACDCVRSCSTGNQPTVSAEQLARGRAPGNPMHACAPQNPALFSFTATQNSPS